MKHKYSITLNPTSQQCNTKVQSQHRSKGRNRHPTKGNGCATHHHAPVEPTPWVNQLTCPFKTNWVWRVYLDPKDLNKDIIHKLHRALTFEQIIHRLAGSTTYSKLDAKKDFWSIHFIHESSLPTTFNTHLGRNHFNWMAFGLKCPRFFPDEMD